MIANRAWVQRNLGFDPITTPAPASTYTFSKASLPASDPEDLQREMIDFDSEAPEGKEFLAFTTATGLSVISWFFREFDDKQTGPLQIRQRADVEFRTAMKPAAKTLC